MIFVRLIHKSLIWTTEYFDIGAEQCDNFDSVEFGSGDIRTDERSDYDITGDVLPLTYILCNRPQLAARKLSFRTMACF